MKKTKIRLVTRLFKRDGYYIAYAMNKNKNEYVLFFDLDDLETPSYVENAMGYEVTNSVTIVNKL